MDIELTRSTGEAHGSVAAGCGGGGACGCGGTRRATTDVLDARLIPPSVRHATVIAAVGAVAAGSELVLLAPHEPLPLLAQISAAYGDTVGWTYDETGPDTWAVRFSRS